VARALVFPVARFEVAAVIRREEHDRVFHQVEALERVEQPAERLVKPFYTAPVAAEMLAGRASQRGKVGRNPPVLISLAVAVGRDEVVDVVLVVRLQER